MPSVPELWRANRHQNHWPGVRGSGGSLETHLRIAGPISSFAAGVHPAANDLVEVVNDFLYFQKILEGFQLFNRLLHSL